MEATALREGRIRTARRLAPGALVVLALAGCDRAAPTPLTVPPYGDAVPALHGPVAPAPTARVDSPGCAPAVRREVPIYIPSGAYRVPLQPAVPEECHER